MARRELGPSALRVAQAVRAALGAGRRRVVLGVSGGADSMALAAGAAWLARSAQRRDDHGLELSAVVVDHGLQSGSDEVAALVVDQLRGLGLAAGVERVEVVDRTGQGLEAAAREARLAALARAAGDDGVVALGHTLDDQAETVLLGLARGSGTRSLAGMRPEGPGPAGVRLLRPLLGLRRAVTRAACAEWGIEVWDDPHNLADRFTRVRVRRAVLPALERELGPGVVEALARTADLARADADALDEWAARAGRAIRCDAADAVSAEPDGSGSGAIRSEAADAVSAEPDGGGSHVIRSEAADAVSAELEGLDCAALAALPEAIRSRVVRRWLLDLGAGEVSAAHVAAVLGLVTDWHGQGPVQVPGLVLVRRGGVVQRAPRR